MRLLGERYLGGKVSFTSSAEAGTVFSNPLAAAGSRSRGDLARACRVIADRFAGRLAARGPRGREGERVRVGYAGIGKRGARA